MKKLYAALLLFGFSLQLAFPVRIERIGMDKGLSNTFVVGITQDKNGFLWFATEAGLNRFDGRRFRVFKKEDGPNQLNANELNQVWADPGEDKIWVATQRDGLCSFDTKKEVFTQYKYNKNDKNSLITNDVTNIAFAGKDKIWFSTYHRGVELFDKKTKTFTHFNQSTIKGFPGNNVWCIADDGKGLLYTGHVFDGLSILNLKDKSIRTFRHNPADAHSLPSNEVLSLHIDKHRNIWVGTNNGLALFHSESGTFTIFRNIPGKPGSLSGNRINDISETDDDRLWVSTALDGLNILDLRRISFQNPQEVLFDHLRAGDSESNLSSRAVKSVFQDCYQNIWIATRGGGINVVRSKNPFFNTWSYSPYRNATNSLCSRQTWALCTDLADNVWIGTNEGIDVFGKSGKLAHYSKENGDLPDNNILCALRDSKGQLWFGTENNDLICYSPYTRRFTTHRIGINSSVRCIFEDRQKNLWIGTNLGLYNYNPRNKKYILYKQTPNGLPDNVVFSLSQDAYGNLWVGTFGQGIAIFDKNFHRIRHIYKLNGFCSNAIHHIYTDKNQRIWVSTREGLVVFKNWKDKEYKVYNSKNGLSDSYVCAVSEGRNGELWMSTNTGISLLNEKTGIFRNFNALDGLPVGNFMTNAVAVKKDGEIYFGSQNGVCWFDSREELADSKLPPVVITGFRFYDRNAEKPEISTTLPVDKRIVLRHHQNTFTVLYNVLDYSLQEGTEYACKLEGFEDSWFNMGNEDLITFRNIPYGQYRFLVRSRLRNQDWKETSTVLEITIRPPFWLTWWAKFLYLLILAYLVRLISRFYIKRLELENNLLLEQHNHQREQELNNERMTFYTQITHELRTPLTLILGPLNDLESDEGLSATHHKKIELINRSAKRLLHLINQIMEFRKTESRNRTLRVGYDDLSKLVTETGMRYRELNLNPDVEIRVSVETNQTRLYFDPEVLTIVLDNLISNALKYTNSGSVTLTLRSVSDQDEEYTEIEVRDTGYGIPEEALKRIFDPFYQVNGSHQAYGSGIGLSLVRNMAELHQGLVFAESKTDAGTAFHFRIRTNNDYPGTERIIQTDSAPDEINGKADAPIVLLVEDNEEIRNYLADSLGNNFRIMQAANGKEGLNKAYEQVPDLIISDIMMPVMDGLTFCKTMKEDIRTSHIPVILLTARDSQQDRMEGYSVGADSYITKPFSAALLNTRVRNLLDSKSKSASDVSTTFVQKRQEYSDSLSKLDQEFLDKLTTLVEDHLDNEQISVVFIAKYMNLSHSTLYRKIKAVTGLSPNEVIKKIRLRKAEQLLMTGKHTISEISYMTGFGSPTYFRECFREEFGLSPKEYLSQFKV